MGEGFKKVRLGDIAQIVSGGTPSRSNPLYWGGSIPWVKTGEIQNGIINLDDIKEKITEEGLKNSSTKIIPAGTILMAMIGQGKTRGQVGVLNCDAAINQNCAAIKLEKHVCRDLVYQSLLSNYQAIRNFSNMGGQGNLSAGLIKTLPIILPPLPEQKAIADILSTWDKAVTLLEKLICLKELNLEGEVQELVNLKCKKWIHTKAETIFEIVTEKKFQDEELLSVTQDRGVIPREMMEGRVMSPAGSVLSYKRVKKGDYVISLRSFQGGIEYSDYQGIISPAYTVLRPKQEICSEYFRLFFKTSIFINKYLNCAVIGIRDGKQISIPDFMNLQLPIPTILEQLEIAEKLNCYYQELNVLRKLVCCYQQQKSGLMQQLLTGKCRVK